MGPRANYECRKCQVTYQDLPIESVRCPVCGLKRGFRRLYDMVNVGQTGGKAKIVDQMLEVEMSRQGHIKGTNHRPDYRSLACALPGNLLGAGAGDKAVSGGQLHPVMKTLGGPKAMVVAKHDAKLT
jgi:hypothetical protein